MIGRRIGYFLIAMGLVGLAVSLGADLVGIGSKGIQAAQILGAQIGVIVALCGIALIIADHGGQLKHFDNLKLVITGQPLIVWALAGFLLAYVLFFIAPVFLDSRLQFQYFYRFLPDGGHIGLDIRTITKYVSVWLIDGKSPYFDNTIFYPPLYNILIAPILLFGYPNSFYVMLGLGLSSYILMTYFVPAWFNPKRDFSFLLFFFISGIFSYGLQFELERAQFNVIAFSLCIYSIYLYHSHPEFRYFAYLFFSISVQLKVFPLIFIVMFIKDWHDWRNNLLRLAGLGAFNFALLFILGYSIFMDFVHSTIVQVSQVGAYTWVGNHSIKAFVFNFLKDGFGWLPESALVWLRQHSGMLEMFLLLYFAACFILIIVASYLRKEQGFNPYLLIACTIGAMVIPSVSHDYKLAILAAPLSIAFSRLSVPQKTSKRVLLFFLVFIASFAYSATLYPFKYRPEFLANSLPLLLVILTAFTVACYLEDSASQSAADQVISEPTL